MGIYGGGVQNFPTTIHLHSFQAKLTQGHILIEWQTSTEHRAADFELERQIDAQDFRKIANFPGSNSTQPTCHYSYCDNPSFGTNNQLPMALNAEISKSNVNIFLVPVFKKWAKPDSCL